MWLWCHHADTPVTSPRGLGQGVVAHGHRATELWPHTEFSELPSSSRHQIHQQKHLSVSASNSWRGVQLVLKRFRQQFDHLGRDTEGTQQQIPVLRTPTPSDLFVLKQFQFFFSIVAKTKNVPYTPEPLRKGCAGQQSSLTPGSSSCKLRLKPDDRTSCMECSN